MVGVWGYPSDIIPAPFLARKGAGGWSKGLANLTLTTEPRQVGTLYTCEYLSGADGARWLSRTSNPLPCRQRGGGWVRLPRAPAMFATQHQRSLTCASSHAMLWADTPQRIPRLLIAERSAGMAHVRALEGICLLVVTFILATGCGPSEEERTKETNRLIAAALTAIPSPTPIQFPTPLPTSTPMPTATPQKVIDLSKVYNQSWPAAFYIDANDRYGSG